MALGVVDMTLTFAKRSKRLYLLFGFPVPLCRRLDLESIYWQNGRREGAVTVFYLLLALTYFHNCDTHLNNGLRVWRLVSVYAEVVRLPTIAAFLVF